MKLNVDGVEYDINESMEGAALGDLMNLKIKTRRPEDKEMEIPKFLGVTVPFIRDVFRDLGDRVLTAAAEEEEAEKLAEAGTPLENPPEGFDYVELLGDERFLDAMTGLVYLARRKAGDNIEVADAARTGFNSVQMVPDEDEVEADPKDEPAVEPPEIL